LPKIIGFVFHKQVTEPHRHTATKVEYTLCLCHFVPLPLFEIGFVPQVSDFEFRISYFPPSEGDLASFRELYAIFRMQNSVRVKPVLRSSKSEVRIGFVLQKRVTQPHRCIATKFKYTLCLCHFVPFFTLALFRGVAFWRRRIFPVHPVILSKIFTP
jgi:hypothetical protein